MTRFWPSGNLITVITNENGSPRHFDWQGQVHLVEMVAKQWRFDMGWWRVRIWRDYFKLTTHSGLLVVIFRDMVTEQWYLQRLYD